MTREDVLKFFPDATDEQITNLLNQTNNELEVEKEKKKKYKTEAEKARELEKKLKDLENSNLTDSELAKKNLDEANERIAELEKTINISNKKKEVMTKFNVTSEDAEKIVKKDGSLDFDVIGEIISNKEIASAKAKEQEIAGQTIPPNGGKGGSNHDGENSFVKEMGKTLSDSDKASQDIIDSYK